MEKILVTGATGFIASHLILQLLDRGYEVRGTARSTEKAGRLNEILSDYAGRKVEIEIVAADLGSDEGWGEAVKGVSYVHHVASPFPAETPKSADELIVPARDGALRGPLGGSGGGDKYGVSAYCASTASATRWWR